MAFQKKKAKTGGRKPGSENKATKEFKEAVVNLLEYAAPDFTSWLQKIDSPAERFRVIKDLAEFAYPKLARQELTGKDGGAIETIDISPEQRREALRRILSAKRS